MSKKTFLKDEINNQMVLIGTGMIIGVPINLWMNGVVLNLIGILIIDFYLIILLLL